MISVEDDNEIKNLYLIDHLSASKIATKFNVSVATICKRLKKLGINVINEQNRVKFNETVFDNIDTEEKAYWLGFIFADGYISSRDNGFEITLKGSDINHLQKFNKFMEHEKNNVKVSKIIYNQKEFSRCRWGVVNKHLWNILNNYGCTPRKSLTLEFPNIIPEHLLKHFIRGYFDGDGCLTYEKENNSAYPSVSLIGTEKFLLKLKNIIGNNIKSSINSDKRLKGSKILRIYRNSVKDFLNYIYENSTIYLDRKYKRYEFFRNSHSVKELSEFLASENGEG